MSMYRKTTEALSNRPLVFVFSTEDVDAYDDSISQHGWVLDEFERNPIALLNHNPDFPIGTWYDIGVVNNQLRGHLRLAPDGTSERIDEVSRLVRAGILKACSVGFVPLESTPRPGSKKGGTRFTKQILRECSVVSLPANASALMMQAERMGISETTMRAVFTQPKNASLNDRQAWARAKREQLMQIERAKRSARSQARNPADDAFDPFSLHGLTDAERAAVIRAKAEMPYSIPQSDNPWQEPPELFFNGQPIYPRKNKFGW